MPGPDGDPDESDQELLDHQAIRLRSWSAQREAIIRLRDDGVIGDEAFRRVERDLDLEAVRSRGLRTRLGASRATLRAHETFGGATLA